MLIPGARVGPYEVLSPLGAGGMGEVYRARDPRLGRDVAIKVLPAEFASDPDRLRRFEREARAVAALEHPNILAIHDVGTHDGAPYIVTELLEGESLGERLKGGALPVSRAVEIAIQIAQGLSAAHEKGIVHRDLKPANVFITRKGRAKILDFGIAKLAQWRNPEEKARATTIAEATEAGTVLGTAGYMSPEQVRGQAVDHRSDIFSFGCVLYEMLSGSPPFTRNTVADTTSAILHDDPSPLASAGREIPPALQEVVSRCLEKSLEERFSSAHDLALALRATSGDAGTAAAARRRPPSSRYRVLALSLAGIALLALMAGLLLVKARSSLAGHDSGRLKRIVVLPFENLGSPEDAYFAAGMTEEITSRLANVQGLGVISRTTAVEYSRRGKTVRQIGTDLGVDFVLEGTVRWEHGQGRENRVRITPQLVRVADDTNVWSDRYDRTLADVFAIQSEVAASAVRAMGVALQPHERSAMEGASTNDLAAYDLFLRGTQRTARSDNRGDIEGALAELRAATERDPRFALALAGVARNCLRMHFIALDRSRDWLAEARDAAQRAVELRPDLGETHDALGWYFYQGLGDYGRALQEFAVARNLQPSNSDALFGIGSVLRRQGKWGESADAIGKGLEIDPRNPTVLVNFAASCVLARRYAEADRAFEAAVVLNPHFGGPYGAWAWLQVQWRGDVERARAILDRAARVGDLSDDQAMLAKARLLVALARRDYEGALRTLDAEPRAAYSNQREYSPIELLRGTVQRLAGKQDAARRSFEAATIELKARAAQTPGDARVHSALAIAYAALGRRKDAVKEADRGCELTPESKDAWIALQRLHDRAAVFVLVGRSADAIAQLDDLMRRSGEMTAHVLRLDPTWDLLRADPRFQALLAKYEVRP